MYNKLRSMEAFAKLSIPSIILLALFFVAVVVQLIFAFFELEKYRRIEKPLLLALLTAFVAVTLPNHPFIYIATFLGMIGDIFVILPKKPFFYAGAASFFLGFVFYALEALIVYMSANVPLFMILVIIGTYVVMFFMFAFFVGPKIKLNRGEQIGLGLYLSPLVTLVVIMVFTSVKGGAMMYLSLIGSIFFLSSDLLITYTKYIKKFKRYDFYVMGTYLIAQFLIVIGFTLSYLA